jgi:hypothetical protein
MLAALAMYATGARQPSPGRASRLSYAAFAVPLVLLALLVRQNMAREAMWQAVLQAGETKWPEAAAALDRATSLDPDLLHYNQQRAYAYGVLAAPASGPGDPHARQQALDSYSKVLAAQRGWAPDLLNTAVLLKEAGAPQRGTDLLAKAVPRWSGSSLPTLLLAENYTQQGRNEDAAALFADALGRHAFARDMAACQSSLSCRDAVQRIAAPADPVSAAHEKARALLSAGLPQQALAALSSVPISHASPLPWLDRGDVYLALGRIPQARYAHEVAAALRAYDAPQTAVRAALLDSALALQLGDTQAATIALESVMRPKVTLLSYDVVRRQFELPGLLAPRLAVLQRNADDLTAYRRLAELYRSQGRAADAAWSEEQANALAVLLAGDWMK